MGHRSTCSLLALLALGWLFVTVPSSGHAHWAADKISKLKGPGSYVAGWSQDSKTFGMCINICTGRESDITLQCYLGSPLKDELFKLSPVTMESWYTSIKLPAEPLKQPKHYVKDFLYKGVTTFDEKEGTCESKLILKHKKGTSLDMLKISGECFVNSPSTFFLSPNTDYLAQFIYHEADHGCGDHLGMVWHVEKGGARRLLQEGINHMEKKKANKALPLFQLALELAPRSEEARFDIACAAAMLGKVKVAVNELRMLLMIDKKAYLEKIQKEPAFDQIRTKAEFQEAIK